MCGYFCIGFIDFMLASKKLSDYTNMFSPHCSFTGIVGAPVGIANASFTLIFSLTRVLTRKLLDKTRKKEENA